MSKTLTQNKTAAAIAWTLALVTFGLYAPALGHAFINFDDEVYLTGNPMVREGWNWRAFVWAWTTGHGANWHPITWLSHLTDCSLFGLNPAGHHATSALLHAANTALLFLLLRKMTGAVWRSAAVAALFGWHPLHVESVAWAAERKDVLSTLFFILTIWAYVRYVEMIHYKLSIIHYCLSVFLFALGLMCKPMLVTLPFVLCLIDYWPLGRIRAGAGARWVLDKLPFLGLSAASCVVTYLVQKSGGAVWEPMSLHGRVLHAVTSYGCYLGRMVWPANLSIIYPYTTQVSVVELGAGVLVLAMVTWLALRCREQRYLATGWLWYLGTLTPVIGLVQAGPQSSADRFTYIPSIGIFVMIVWGAAELAAKWRVPLWGPAVAGVVVLMACAALTERQLSFWFDSGTLFRHALAVTKDNYMAWNNLGTYWLRQGKNEEALQCFKTSYEECAKPVNCRNMGRALQALRRPLEAVAFFDKALALDPNYTPARMSLADSLADDGKNAEAAIEYRKVLQLAPDDEDAHCNLACVLAAQGQMSEAMTQLQQALSIDPADASARCNLGNLLTEQGKLEEAAAEYRAALRAKPGSPEIHSNLGMVLALQGRRQQAADEFNEALRLAPDFAQARERLKALSGR